MAAQPNRTPDFTATLRFLRSEEGGRRGSVTSGYCPNHDFGDRVGLAGAFHKYDSDRWIAPGETAEATLWLLTPEVHRAVLTVGQAFTVQEASHIVGHGVITAILNTRLLRPPSQ